MNSCTLALNANPKPGIPFPPSEDICRPCWAYVQRRRDPLSAECKRRISSRDAGDYRAIKVAETREDIGGKNTRLI
ncbi:hypothetical protein WN48_05903 [Eufriesea mexicana]|uniref:Uncharacterized protein n=1 Tax=Eufriesea mexicana TaxID=516756 RepID=A0A310SHV4_9HYME|nr:hypothetical protein WN48_05903 [Eufriesea mexicana]